MQQDPHRAQAIVMRCCTLHHLLQTRYPFMAMPIVEGGKQQWERGHRFVRVRLKSEASVGN